MTDQLDPARLDALWDFTDPDATAERFRAELSTASPVAADELRTQLARALGLADRGAEADELLDSIVSESAVVRVRVALERGRRLNSSGKPGEAVPFFAAALELAQSAGEDFLAVDALHMFGIADQANTRRVDEPWHPGRRIVRGLAHERWAIALNNNLGWYHFDAGRFDEALAAFEVADAAARVHGSAQQQQWAQEAARRMPRGDGRTPPAELLKGSEEARDVVEGGRYARALHPLVKGEFPAVRPVLLLQLLQVAEDAGAPHHHGDLEVEGERAHVHVARANHGDLVVDSEELRVQHCGFLVEPDAHASAQQLLVVAALGVIDHELVADFRGEELHVQPALRGSRDRVEHRPVGHEVRARDDDLFGGGVEQRVEQPQVVLALESWSARHDLGVDRALFYRSRNLPLRAAAVRRSPRTSRSRTARRFRRRSAPRSAP